MYRRLNTSNPKNVVSNTSERLWFTKHLPKILEPQLVLPPSRVHLLLHPLQPIELTQPGFICAIDAEFVSLCEEEAEYSSEGMKRIMKPRVLSLARVSVIRGNGPLAGTVCVDEYIDQRSPVVDYITAFSGIEPRHLDRNISQCRLVSLKSIYRKLRCMVDAGVKFAGHSLEQDFRIINLVVPMTQVIDTCRIYHIPSAQRKLSLKFLAWAVLGEHVQLGNHDSVEDARTALALYNRYRDIYNRNVNEWNTYLRRVYELGYQHGFKPPKLNEPIMRPVGNNNTTTNGSNNDTMMTTTNSSSGGIMMWDPAAFPEMISANTNNTTTISTTSTNRHSSTIGCIPKKWPA